jgi:hypothetical protein
VPELTATMLAAWSLLPAMASAFQAYAEPAALPAARLPCTTTKLFDAESTKPIHGCPATSVMVHMALMPWPPLVYAVREGPHVDAAALLACTNFTTPVETSA